MATRPSRLSKAHARVCASVTVLCLLSHATAHAQDAPPPPLTQPAQPSTETSPSTEALPENVTPEQRYKRGKNLFDYGDCKAVQETLSPLGVPGLLQDEKQQVDVHRMLGICDALLGDNMQAAREFSSLLAIDPDFVLDPFFAPPAAVEVFEKQKAQMKERLDEIRRAQELARANGIDEEGGVLVEERVTTSVAPFVTTLMPFGIGQALNGDNGKAIAFGIVQGALLATNATAYWANQAVTGDKITNDNELLVHTVLWYTHVAALAGFVGAYAVGVGDAVWNRPGPVVVDKKRTRRALTPEEIKKIEKIKKQPATPPAPTTSAP